MFYRNHQECILFTLLYRYSPSVKSLSDRFMHLTNYSINRYNSEYRTNNDSGACTGHKWYRTIRA